MPELHKHQNHFEEETRGFGSAEVGIILEPPHIAVPTLMNALAIRILAKAAEQEANRTK